MVLHPDVQSRALAEINAVCGDNVPNFDHRSSLPYIDAICREVLRWHPITPLGLPHMTSRDDVYAGYLIPKGPHTSYFFPWYTLNPKVITGSLVMVNEWYVVYILIILSLRFTSHQGLYLETTAFIQTLSNSSPKGT